MQSSSICSSVPSILRNSRYRRDQRQLEEEEEMWFNEDDDSDEVIPFPNEIIGKKMDTDLESIGKNNIILNLNSNSNHLNFFLQS